MFTDREEDQGWQKRVKLGLPYPDAMKGEMSRRVVYGSERLIKKVEKEYKIGAVIRHRGRPIKKENDDK